MNTITREMVWAALKVYSSLESEGSTTESYDRAKKRKRSELLEADTVIRGYGTQITPMTLDNMQDEFYILTDISNYSTAYDASVAKSVISTKWDDIGPWCS